MAPKGSFVSLDYTSDALREIDAFFRKSGKIIITLTVRQILKQQRSTRLQPIGGTAGVSDAAVQSGRGPAHAAILHSAEADMNGDGVSNGADIDPFVQAMLAL